MSSPQAAAASLLHSFEDWEEFYNYVTLYVVHIVLGTFLSAVTIYRREMSCNRVFHQETEPATEDDETTSSGSQQSSTSNEDNDGRLEYETEELLEGAGLYCSGQAIFSLASQWLDSFPEAATTSEEAAASSSCGLPPPSKYYYWLHHHPSEEDVTPDDLLERAGNYCSGEPILAALALILLKHNQKALPSTTATAVARTGHHHPFTNELPPDVHVHIASFLHPKDVVTLSCVSKTYRDVVDNNNSDTSMAIWKTLWNRDYAWIIHGWSVGRDAWRRSNGLSSSTTTASAATTTTTTALMVKYDKDFYFLFAQSYLNYVLAGQNTADRCLVGLHFNIYDITSFLDTHPGSPDTLMVHAGKDSTRFFEDMGHSMGARRLARSLCVVADLSHTNRNSGTTGTAEEDNGGWGLRPTRHTVLIDDDHIKHDHSDTRRNHSPVVDLPSRVLDDAGDNLLLGRRNKQPRKRSGGTLERIRNHFVRDQEQVRRRIFRRYSSDPSVLGEEANLYYDPFRKEWRIWYTDDNLQTVYLPAH